MRSKVFQRVLDNMKKDPWYIKLHRWVVVELHDIKCMGIVKYIKHKKQSHNKPTNFIKQNLVNMNFI